MTWKKKTIENVQTNFLEKYIATIYQKNKSKSFKETILQNLCNNTKEIFDIKFATFKSKCEEQGEMSSVRCNKQIEHLQNELKTKDKMIDQFLMLLSNLANSEFENSYIN